MTEAHYSGVEPVEIGDLSQVREQRTVLPATRRVKVKIVRADNLINKDNTYRQIALGLRLEDGIEGKYKGMYVNARVCYYADPNVYTKDFFQNKQHLVQLKYLLNATGIEIGAIDGHTLDKLREAPPILVDIIQRKRVVEEVEQLENEARNFKPVPAEEQV